MMPAIYGNAYEIVQGPGWVGIRYEMIHEARIIPLDGRPHVGKDVKLDMGDAARPLGRRHAGDRDDQLPRRSAYRNANPDAFKLVERFKPISPSWSSGRSPSTTRRPGRGRGRSR